MKNMKSSKNKENYYVNPIEFKEEIGKYYESNVCTNYLGDCINKIAEGLSYSPSFLNYSFKEDMIGDARVKMWSALARKKYNMIEATNPFSYFTTIAFHAFINRIKKEKKYHETITEFRERKYEELITSAEGNVYVKPNLLSEDIENYIGSND